MATADLYLRLSLDYEGATSIDRQEADCRRWYTANGVTVRRVHVDRGVSGFSETAHRDGFDAALAAIVTAEVATLVVWKLDRLSRRGIGQVGQLLDQFERAGGRLVSVKDGLDTAQPQTRMIIALLSEFARAESETMGVRIKSAKRASRASGLWLSGKPPFGYAIAPDRRLRPVQPAAAMMKEVFDLIVAGHTLVAICHRLNERGARNSRGAVWRTSALSSAIKTPAYAGLTPERHVNARGKHASGYPKVFRDRHRGGTRRSGYARRRTPLDDPAHVAEQWRLSTSDARRDLLRLAWTKIVIAKSSQPGGHFDPDRISYVSAP